MITLGLTSKILPLHKVIQSIDRGCERRRSYTSIIPHYKENSLTQKMYALSVSGVVISKWYVLKAGIIFINITLEAISPSKREISKRICYLENDQSGLAHYFCFLVSLTVLEPFWSFTPSSSSSSSSSSERSSVAVAVVTALKGDYSRCNESRIKRLTSRECEA